MEGEHKGAWSILLTGVMIGIVIGAIIASTKLPPCVQGAINNYDLVWSEEYISNGGCMVKTNIDGNDVLLSIDEYESLISEK